MPLIRFVILASLMVAGGGVAGEEITGVWLVEEKDAHVEIAPCGDKLCGRIVWLEEPLDEHGEAERDDENPDPSLRGRPLMGLQILEGFAPQPTPKGLWTGGTIYDPNNGKTYKCHISKKDEKTLKIRGYIGISLIGRTAYWTQVETEPR